MEKNLDKVVRKGLPEEVIVIDPQNNLVDEPFGEISFRQKLKETLS